MLTKRVRASIRRRGFDAIPWQFDLTGAVIDRLELYHGTDDIRTALDDHVQWVHLERPADVPQPDDPALVRDELGAVWHRGARDRAVGDWGELADHPLREPSLEGYRFPDGNRPGRWDHVAEVRRWHPDRFLVAGLHGLFEPGWALCGFQEYLAYVAGRARVRPGAHQGPARVPHRHHPPTRRHGRRRNPLRRRLGLPGSAHGAPQVWRSTYKRHYAKLYGTARDLGLVVAIHSCGNITDILGDLVDIGVQVVHPLQPEAMDVERCRRQFGRHLTFWGGLGSQSTLPRSTVAEVRDEVRRRLDLFRDGGYILAPAGAVPAETPAESIAAIAEEARAQFAR